LASSHQSCKERCFTLWQWSKASWSSKTYDKAYEQGVYNMYAIRDQNIESPIRTYILTKHLARLTLLLHSYRLISLASETSEADLNAGKVRGRWHEWATDLHVEAKSTL
jgi:hypothetical protein